MRLSFFNITQFYNYIIKWQKSRGNILGTPLCINPCPMCVYMKCWRLERGRTHNGAVERQNVCVHEALEVGERSHSQWCSREAECVCT